MKSKKRSQAARHQRTTTDRSRSGTPLLQRIEPDAAGIDCGAEYHYVAVPPDRDARPVRAFQTFTTDLQRLADWLVQCGVKTVAMESTGVYWIPVYEILKARGLEVVLVNARHLRNVRGRKSDVSDCRWLRDLHSVGLLSPSLPPRRRDRGAALLHAPAREFGARGCHPYPAHAEGVDRDESSASRRAQ